MSEENYRYFPVQFEQLEDDKNILGSDKFTKMKIWIANVGENLNNSYFSKESLTLLAETLPYTPITGFIGENQYKETDFRGHEMELIKIKGSGANEDDLEFRYLGFAYGFVPQDPEWKFEEKLCSDGEERTYLTCSCYLWTKWNQVTDIFNRDGWSKSQSMELKKVSGIFEEDKLFHINSAVFDALTILGTDIKPGIIDSRIEAFSFDSLKFQIKEMIEEFNNIVSDNLVQNFIKKDDFGSGEKIETNLTKESASNDNWSSVNKTSLRNSILKAKNYKSLVKNTYLIVEDGWEDAPSEHLKISYLPNKR